MRFVVLAVALAACQSSPNHRATRVPAPSTQAASVETLDAPGEPIDDLRPQPPPSKRFEHDMMLRFHMHGSLDLVRAIERLLIRGSVEEARSLARAIAEAPSELDLGAWAVQAMAVRERAAAVAAAPGLDEAIRREARLAEACADCHVETRIQPEFRAWPPLPPDRDTVEARMARHRWAADRLWEGVIGGDDGPWRAGLGVLAAAPLRWPELSERKGFARSLQQLADQARQRQATDSVAERARSYGEMLVVCAACHTTRPAP
ncbi:MAG TPA: hypothetical protein VFK02_20900 [Kofleriaceae bacterium]|nr:hypothetical protein [Kofleriaceae bacterium]